jgi:hypothetical protein
MDVAGFRAAYPAFSDAVRYPDAMVTAQLAVAAIRLDPVRWDTLLDSGVGLFVAHQLALTDRGASFAAPTASKSVDKVSVSYDTAAVSLVDGGYWNATPYGVQFLQLSRMIGAGGIQL